MSLIKHKCVYKMKIGVRRNRRDENFNEKYEDYWNNMLYQWYTYSFTTQLHWADDIDGEGDLKCFC